MPVAPVALTVRRTCRLSAHRSKLHRPLCTKIQMMMLYVSEQLEAGQQKQLLMHAWFPVIFDRGSTREFFQASSRSEVKRFEEMPATKFRQHSTECVKVRVPQSVTYLGSHIGCKGLFLQEQTSLFQSIRHSSTPRAHQAVAGLTVATLTAVHNRRRLTVPRERNDMHQLIGHSVQRPCCPRAPAQHNSSSSGYSISSSRAARHNTSNSRSAGGKRSISRYAAAAGGDAAGGMKAAPELSALNRLDLSSAMLLANLMQAPGQQQVRTARNA
jgi:hypothetical protein